MLCCREQKLWRSALSKHRAQQQEELQASVHIQSLVRMHYERAKFNHTLEGAKHIQAVWRGSLVRFRCANQFQSAIQIQSAWRGRTTRKEFAVKKAKAVLLQAMMRSFLARASLANQQASAVAIQSHVRRRINEVALKKAISAAATINRLFRGMHARRVKRKKAIGEREIATAITSEVKAAMQDLLAMVEVRADVMATVLEPEELSGALQEEENVEDTGIEDSGDTAHAVSFSVETATDTDVSDAAFDECLAEDIGDEAVAPEPPFMNEVDGEYDDGLAIIQGTSPVDTETPTLSQVDQDANTLKLSSPSERPQMARSDTDEALLSVIISSIVSSNVENIIGEAIADFVSVQAEASHSGVLEPHKSAAPVKSGGVNDKVPADVKYVVADLVEDMESVSVLSACVPEGEFASPAVDAGAAVEAVKPMKVGEPVEPATEANDVMPVDVEGAVADLVAEVKSASAESAYVLVNESTLLDEVVAVDVTAMSINSLVNTVEELEPASVCTEMSAAQSAAVDEMEKSSTTVAVVTAAEVVAFDPADAAKKLTDPADSQTSVERGDLVEPAAVTDDDVDKVVASTLGDLVSNVESVSALVEFDVIADTMKAVVTVDPVKLLEPASVGDGADNVVLADVERTVSDLVSNVISASASTAPETAFSERSASLEEDATADGAVPTNSAVVKFKEPELTAVCNVLSDVVEKMEKSSAAATIDEVVAVTSSPVSEKLEDMEVADYPVGVELENVLAAIVTAVEVASSEPEKSDEYVAAAAEHLKSAQRIEPVEPEISVDPSATSTDVVSVNVGSAVADLVSDVESAFISPSSEAVLDEEFASSTSEVCADAAAPAESIVENADKVERTAVRAALTAVVDEFENISATVVVTYISVTVSGDVEVSERLVEAEEVVAAVVAAVEEAVADPVEPAKQIDSLVFVADDDPEATDAGRADDLVSTDAESVLAHLVADVESASVSVSKKPVQFVESYKRIESAAAIDMVSIDVENAVPDLVSDVESASVPALASLECALGDEYASPTEDVAADATANPADSVVIEEDPERATVHSEVSAVLSGVMDEVESCGPTAVKDPVECVEPVEKSTKPATAAAFNYDLSKSEEPATPAGTNADNAVSDEVKRTVSDLISDVESASMSISSACALDESTSLGEVVAATVHADGGAAPACPVEEIIEELESATVYAEVSTMLLAVIDMVEESTAVGNSGAEVIADTCAPISDKSEEKSKSPVEVEVEEIVAAVVTAVEVASSERLKPDQSVSAAPADLAVELNEQPEPMTVPTEVYATLSAVVDEVEIYNVVAEAVTDACATVCENSKDVEVLDSSAEVEEVVIAIVDVVERAESQLVKPTAADSVDTVEPEKSVESATCAADAISANPVSAGVECVAMDLMSDVEAASVFLNAEDVASPGEEIFDFTDVAAATDSAGPVAEKGEEPEPATVHSEVYTVLSAVVTEVEKSTSASAVVSAKDYLVTTSAAAESVATGAPMFESFEVLEGPGLSVDAIAEDGTADVVLAALQPEQSPEALGDQESVKVLDVEDLSDCSQSPPPTSESVTDIMECSEHHEGDGEATEDLVNEDNNPPIEEVLAIRAPSSAGQDASDPKPASFLGRPLLARADTNEMIFDVILASIISSKVDNIIQDSFESFALDKAETETLGMFDPDDDVLTEVTSALKDLVSEVEKASTVVGPAVDTDPAECIDILESVDNARSAAADADTEEEFSADVASVVDDLVSEIESASQLADYADTINTMEAATAAHSTEFVESAEPAAAAANVVSASAVPFDLEKVMADLISKVESASVPVENVLDEELALPDETAIAGADVDAAVTVASTDLMVDREEDPEPATVYSEVSGALSAAVNEVEKCSNATAIGAELIVVAGGMPFFEDVDVVEQPGDTDVKEAVTAVVAAIEVAAALEKPVESVESVEPTEPVTAAASMEQPADDMVLVAVKKTVADLVLDVESAAVDLLSLAKRVFGNKSVLSAEQSNAADVIEPSESESAEPAAAVTDADKSMEPVYIEELAALAETDASMGPVEFESVEPLESVEPPMSVGSAETTEHEEPFADPMESEAVAEPAGGANDTASVDVESAVLGMASDVASTAANLLSVSVALASVPELAEPADVAKSVAASVIMEVLAMEAAEDSAEVLKEPMNSVDRVVSADPAVFATAVGKRQEDDGLHSSVNSGSVEGGLSSILEDSWSLDPPLVLSNVLRRIEFEGEGINPANIEKLNSFSRSEPSWEDRVSHWTQSDAPDLVGVEKPKEKAVSTSTAIAESPSSSTMKTLRSMVMGRQRSMSEDYLFSLIGQCEGDIEDLEDGLSEAYASIFPNEEDRNTNLPPGGQSQSVDWVTGSYGSVRSLCNDQKSARFPQTDADETEVKPSTQDKKASTANGNGRDVDKEAVSSEHSADHDLGEVREPPMPAPEVGWDPLGQDRTKVVRNVVSLYVYTTLQYALLEVTSRLEDLEDGEQS